MYALPRIYDFSTVEREVASYWLEKDIPRRVMEMNRGALPFAFLEGPPTVNGFMHIGHARGRIYKDIVLRYYTLRGFDVWRRAGWDCQGLPTEIETERRLGITSKKDIERIGMDRFVEEANKLVDFYIERWRADSERLALWLDYDNAYQTRHERYMEHVWYLLKKAYDSGDLYVSYRVVPICPRCETPLSSHEVAQGYDEIEDYSLYAKFRVEGSRDRYLLIWTTTPWTLPGNEAVAVHPDAEYVEVDVGGERLIVARQLLAAVMQEIGVQETSVIKTMKGEELVGTRYVHPLAEEVPVHADHEGKAHTVLPAEYVSMDEGTGLVHTAPGHGPEDYELGRRFDLPIFCPINQSGIFTEAAGDFAGLYHRNAAPLIINRLREKGLLLHEGRLTHTYPLCWRCDTPLVYISSRQWFLRVERIKRDMISENSKVKWYPPWAGQSRFGEWLQNAEDWCISRTKIWGTPLNVWSCERCGAQRVVGSLDELQMAETKPEVIRMHRPWIDMVTFKCGECGGEMRREPFVLDTWLDSGVAHFASVDYLRDKRLFELLYPYDFVTEAIDQTRGWFYTLLFTSVLLFGKAPYRSVLNQGHVLDKEGKKMSKSRGNVVWASEAIERFGVDSLRFYLVSKAQPWDAVNFDPDEVKQVESTLNILWNAASFFKTYFDLDKFSPERETLDWLLPYSEPEDRWIVSRVNSLLRQVGHELERFEIHDAARSILRFISEDLSRTYIRSVRRRFWTEERTKQKLAAYAASHYVLMRLLVMLSVFAPYLAEYLYLRFGTPRDPESISLNKWPRVDEHLIDQELEDAMQIADDIISASLNARQRGKRKLRWPVSRLIVSPSSPRAHAAVKKLQKFIQRQTNSLRLEILEPGQRPRELITSPEPVLSKIGPRAGRRLQMVVEAVRSARVIEMRRAFERGERYALPLPDGSLFEVAEDEVRFTERLPDWLIEAEGKFARVCIDLSEDEALRRLSVVNEVVRRIQVMRKELNLEITREVECRIYLEPPQLAELVNEMIDYIEEETRTRLMLLKQPPSGSEGHVKEWNIGYGRSVICIVAS